ncbi:hypothetical protein RSOL_344460 [Rhizoctonia solani AG-3 Rhs1AP]|uniref:DNA 3'-5' helicase n=2 Tax=Rhizoctonia solani AG-3 TaxID=1086053 RepID=X8JBX7_9AGAM|nr:hypothetical protein RSOL_344460 [Rhizoctonia solani AG-3 Rhs1AP]
MATIKIIFCSPERLASAEMVDLLSNKALQGSLDLVVIDEVHLVPAWGGDGSGLAFWSAFKAVRNLRSLLGSQTVFLALTATLLPGLPTRTVLKQLGFEGPKFAFMKRDCSRPNLHLTLRKEFRCGIPRINT